MYPTLKLALRFGVVALSFAFVAPSAFSSSENLFVSELTQALVEAQNQQALNVINWKVGDTQIFSVSAMFGMTGQMVKSVTKDEGSALWIKQQINLANQNEVVETLLNKADGKVLKMIRNGQEQPLPSDDDKPEIISQDYGPVTVPAGTFQAIHIVAKTKQVKRLELWANPRDTVMEGTLKTMIDQGFIKMTMELKEFKKAE